MSNYPTQRVSKSDPTTFNGVDRNTDRRLPSSACHRRGSPREAGGPWPRRGWDGEGGVRHFTSILTISPHALPLLARFVGARAH